MTDFSDPEIKAVEEVFKGKLQSSYTFKSQHLPCRQTTYKLYVPNIVPM